MYLLLDVYNYQLISSLYVVVIFFYILFFHAKPYAEDFYIYNLMYNQ